ncbi:MAG TPA: hypothetical protein VGH19_20505 [Verrucomicrobiae bacterium]
MQAAKRDIAGKKRTPIRGRKMQSVLGLGVAFTLSGLAASAEAQEQSRPEFTAANDRLQTGNAPDAAAAALGGELTASKVIADPGAPYENLFQNFGVNLGVTPKFGAAQTYFKTGPLNLGMGADTPIKRGFQPDTAELKIGNFYLDLDYLSASLLYTDNANLSETNRRDDVLSAVTLGISALYQLTEGLQIGVSGAVIWLPLENRIGLAGFGLIDPFARFALDGQPLFQAGISYDMILGGWDIRLFDEFRANNRSIYGYGDSGFIDLYDGETFDSQGDDRVRNQQVYYAPNNNPQAVNQPNTQTTRFDADNTDLSNTVGVIATRSLPTETRASLAYYHQNFWDLSSNNLPGAAQVDSLDSFIARLDSERENLRFKPYSQYTATKNNLQDGWDQTVTVGLRGPITENMFFDGNIGYVFSGNTDNTSLIWLLRLTHEINPTTVHMVDYSRVLTQPDRFLTQNYSYQIAKILGPYLSSSAYVRRLEAEDLDNSNSLFTLDQAGAYLRYDLGEHGQAQIQAFYSKYDFASAAFNDYELYTLRFLYSRQISATVYGDFMYQFEKRESTAAGDSYYENLVALRLTKYF